MKIFFILILIVFIITKFSDFFTQKNKDYNIQKKETFKNQIKDFAIKFLQPLISEDNNYQLYSPLKPDKIRIFIKLLQEEYGKDYLEPLNIISNNNFELNKIQRFIKFNKIETLKLVWKITGFDLKNATAIVDEIVNLKEMPTDSNLIEIINLINTDILDSSTYINSCYWTFNDSVDLLNGLLFDVLFKKFVKQFAKDNEDCIDDWESIRDCYIRTFENNMDYLIYIKHYASIKNIKIPSNPELSIKNYIKDINIKKQASEYKKLMENNQKNKKYNVSIGDVDTMDGVDFEELLALIFKRLNYNVKLTKATGDQGADLIIEKLDKRTIVQAKRYSSKVSNKAIQEAVGAISFYDANNAIVVTNNYFTKSAIELAKKNNVELWDREKLIEQLNLYPITIDN